MEFIDVFNGDADGICALHQLRLAEPREAELVTGVKRDIGLLSRVNVQAGDSVTVLDVSLDKNRVDVLRLLNCGASVLYFDHHFAGQIPASGKIQTFINMSADVCTSLLVNEYLQGKHLPWAVAAAFGDNIFDSARRAAVPLGLDESHMGQLEQLGTLINYNGYGLTLDDLYFRPDELYREIRPFENPFVFIEESQAFEKLNRGYESDMMQARDLAAEIEEPRVKVMLLPDAAWTRRVSGVFGNELARSAPERAHALMSELPDGDFRVSVRAPLNNKSGADELCMLFPTGGGRKAAAGINALPADSVELFIDAFREKYGQS